MGLTFQNAILSNQEHADAIVNLLNEYRADPMGGSLPKMTSTDESLLIQGLSITVNCFIVLAKTEKIFCGMAVCFWGYSTFLCKPLCNIHDFIISKYFRSKGIGLALLRYVQKEAENRGCAKITLEVRSDNSVAKSLYSKAGFSPGKNPMEFWIREI